MKQKFIISLVISCCLCISCNKNYNNSPEYIAHAGGQIEGFKYSNSLEAVENAIKHDIKYIELDLVFTEDNQLIASHEWMGCEHWLTEGVVPTYEQFMSHKLYERYTPLDYERIDSILNANPQLTLVTDKTSNPEIIEKYFGKYKHRVVVECFSDNDYIELQQKGYQVYRSQWPPTKIAVLAHIVKHLSFRDFKIRNYVWNGYFNLDSHERYGNKFAHFTYPDRATADSAFQSDKRIKLCYIDNIE